MLNSCFNGCIADGDLRVGKGAWESVGFDYRDDKVIEGFEKISTAGQYLTWTNEFPELLNSIIEKRLPSCTGYNGRAALEVALALRRIR